MSEHPSEKPTETAPTVTGEAPQPAQVPVLRREAVYVVTDPRKFAGVAAVTALAGVAIGFALALLAQPMHHCPAQVQVRVIEGSVAQPAMGAPEASITWLGVQITTLSEPGATVVDVLDRTPAERAGLIRGDRVVSLDGDAVQSAQDLVRAVRRRDAGQMVVVGYVRDGTPGNTTAVLSAISPQSAVLW